MGDKVNYLNIGCGKKFHNDWENIDMDSHSRHVREYNLLKGFPYSDNKFDVVYHSQVLEHIPKKDAAAFLKECFRVLSDGGTLRVVVPNLENIIGEYQRLLKVNLENPTPESRASYEWIMFEIYDQVIRNNTGGLMKEYLRKPDLVNPDFMATRMGYIGKTTQKNKQETAVEQLKRVYASVGLFSFTKKIIGIIKQKTLQTILGKKYALGDFRLGGEIHYWMYDRFSLKELLESVGFQDIEVKSPHSSGIVDWEKYELDVKDGNVYDPTSLFIEAKKVTSKNA